MPSARAHRLRSSRYRVSLLRTRSLSRGGMMNEADDRRIRALEDQIKAMAPIVTVFNAGTMLGKILVILGGMAVGAATVWGAIASFIQWHTK